MFFRLLKKRFYSFIAIPDRGHAETQEVQGEIRDLVHDLIDENLKGIDEWFERQNRYSRKDMEFELDWEKNGLRISELFSGDPLKRRAAIFRSAATIIV